MLPPFVPPSARVTSETLPVITEFVIDRVERSFEKSGSAGARSVTAAAPETSFGERLRSIEDFRWRPEVRADLQDEPDALGVIGLPDSMEGGPADVAPSPSPIPSGTLAFVEETLPDSHPAGVPAPIVNDDADEGAAWAAAAAGAALQAPVADTHASSEAPAEPELTPASEVTTAPDVAASAPASAADSWVAEERDAFDWRSVANLAVTPDEERRAAEDWSSTRWERQADSAQDHVAGLLSQIARRVRAGELPVQGSRQMSAEAALAAVLAALLSDQSADE